MPLQLVAFDSHPHRIAATKVDSRVSGGRFFLDFTRPLEFIRWLAVNNRFLGVVVVVFVPVVHERERSGRYVFGVNAGEPYFNEIRRLWKAHYPSASVAVEQEAGGAEIIASFAAQFLQDCYDGLLHELDAATKSGKTLQDVLDEKFPDWPRTRHVG